MSFYQRINALEIWSTISCDRPEGPHQIPVAFATHVLAVLTTRPPAIGNIIKEVSMNRLVLPVSVIHYTARHSRRPAQNNNEYSALDAVRHGRRVQGPGTHGLHENIRREKAVDSPQRLPGAHKKRRRGISRASFFRRDQFYLPIFFSFSRARSASLLPG